METALLFIKKMVMVLSGTMSHVTWVTQEKLFAKGKGGILIKGKSTKAKKTKDALSLIKNSHYTTHYRPDFCHKFSYRNDW